MYAQVITFDEDPAAVQHGIDHVLADVVPALEESDGAKGLWLVDREHGKRLSIMVWESEEAAQAAFARIATRAAANPGERPKPVSVERFEIYAQV